MKITRAKRSTAKNAKNAKEDKELMKPILRAAQYGFFVLNMAAGQLSAQDWQVPAPDRGGAAARRAAEAPSDVLSADEWEEVDAAVNRALAWLAAQQEADGSFPTLPTGQPGVTSLVVLAFMAHGHNPGVGQFGKGLQRAIKYVLSCQMRNGCITLVGPDFPLTSTFSSDYGPTAAYNHAISSLLLAETYGMGGSDRTEANRQVIDRALTATLIMQRWPKDQQFDAGGWRYIRGDERDSDLSITGWHLMFLRSARNAGFNVPKEAIDDAIGFVRRSFDKDLGTFTYYIKRDRERSRGMAGAGILALAHAGFHNSVEAQSSGKWLLKYSFQEYNGNEGFETDRYHYSLFNCCQGMYQLGSPFWEQFFPRTVRAVLANQRPDGSWEAESHQNDRMYGNAYATALVVLAFGAPNQLLPIFQR